MIHLTQFEEREAEYLRIIAPLKDLTDEERCSLFNFWLGMIGQSASMTNGGSDHARDLMDGALDYLAEMRTEKRQEVAA